MSGKRLLKNVLAHTGSQNKKQEEREMWRLRALEKTAHWEDDSAHKQRSMLTRGRLLSDTLPLSPPPSSHCHQDHQWHISPKEKWRGSEREGYWTRLLLKQEENDPSRWGHSGYKEVYAEEFASSESEDSEKEKRTVKRRHKHSKTVTCTNGRVKKVKKSRSELSGSDGTHHSTRKRRRESSSSDEESSVRLKPKTKRRGVREERRKDKKRRDKHRHKSHTSDKPKRKYSTTDTD